MKDFLTASLVKRDKAAVARTGCHILSAGTEIFVILAPPEGERSPNGYEEAVIVKKTGEKGIMAVMTLAN